jgi:cysteine desulfurase
MAARRAYLDYNASAPLTEAARAAMLSALSVDANPSSVHAEGRAARRVLDEARRAVAALAGGREEHVVFTSGATEAASMLLTPHWRLGRGDVRMARLYVSATDHPCLLGGGHFAPEDVARIPVDRDGLLDCPALERMLAVHDRDAGMALVAVHAANNETGVIQPLAEIGRIAKAAGAVLVVDAVQAAGRVALDISDGSADFLILSSHKIGGPKGAGAIVAASDLLMPVPLVRGGGQEKGHRAGTENVAAIAGFGAAAREALAGLERMPVVRAMRDDIEAAIRHIVPDATIFGAGAPRLPNTVFFDILGMKAETAQIAFDLSGIALSAGSACSSGRVGPSHVLEAMGFGDDQAALRVSIGPSTTQEDVDRFRAALASIAERVGGERTKAA